MGSKVARVNNSKSASDVNCPWSLNNCGPNDEPYGFHGGGVLAVFGDGHVGFIRDATTAQVLRALSTPAGGENVELP